MMRTWSVLVVALTVTAGAAAMPNRTPGESQHPTREEVKALVKEAHTPEQFRTLATYYGELQSKYLQKAADEKLEWQRRAQSTAALAQKYPRPVDSARNLYDYFMAKAAEMGDLKAKYASKAEPAGPAAVQ